MSGLQPMLMASRCESSALAQHSLYANAIPLRIVRLCSWKGRISISGEWNQADYELDEVRKFLDDVAALMLLVTEMRDEAPLGVV